MRGGGRGGAHGRGRLLNNPAQVQALEPTGLATVVNLMHKLRFVPPAAQFELCGYKMCSTTIKLPIRGFFQMKAINENSTRILVQLKLEEGLPNQFDFCEARVPFQGRTVASIDGTPTSGSLAVSPSGRLPVTWYGDDYLSQVGPILDYSSTSGVGRTYRYLNTTASPPLFRFGYGLGFTRWAYSGLVVDGHDPAVGLNVSVKLTNVGAVTAAEVVQVYVTVPDPPGFPVPVPRLGLVGFAKTTVAAGAATTVRFAVAPRQYCTVGASGACAMTPGTYTVAVSGHQPGDPLGEAQSNTVTATFVVAAPGGG